MNVNERIETLKIVPVVVIQDAKDAVPLAKALTAGGLSVAEVTFRTDAAEASIRAKMCIRDRYILCDEADLYSGKIDGSSEICLEKV